MKRFLLALALLSIPTLAGAQVVHWGDFEDADQTEYVAFNTLSQAGVPVTITNITTGATDAIVFYNTSSTTEITAADTIDLNFDTLTGLHRVTINFGSAAFADGRYIAVLVDADATADGVALTNRILATFNVGTHATTTEIGQQVETELDDRLLSATAKANSDTIFADLDLDTVIGYFLTSSAEPTGTPSATATLVEKISWLYMGWRNQKTVTATEKTIFDDGGAEEIDFELSDDGTTYTETEAAAAD